VLSSTIFSFYPAGGQSQDPSSPPGRTDGKWFKFLENELFLQDRPEHGQDEGRER
jgi:hypothetical protein